MQDQKVNLHLLEIFGIEIDLAKVIIVISQRLTRKH